MEIKGKVIAILPEQTGTGKNGEWKAQEFVIETADQYPKKVCFKCFNKPVPKIDETVNVFADAESREYNGRWYTTLLVWKFETEGSTSKQSQPTQTIEPTPQGSDLPFN